MQQRPDRGAPRHSARPIYVDVQQITRMHFHSRTVPFHSQQTWPTQQSPPYPLAMTLRVFLEVAIPCEDKKGVGLFGHHHNAFNGTELGREGWELVRLGEEIIPWRICEPGRS